MKAIIDTLREIIKKDASTQTDPVTIIENKKSMTEIIPSKRVSPGESDVTTKRQKLFDVTNIYSGKEHVQEEIQMEEEQKIKSDASFYDKCKAYLNNVDPTNDTYYSLKQVIEAFIKDKVDLNEYIKGNVFSTNAECYETPEEISDVLKNITAAMYMILKEKAIDLGIGNSLKDAIYTDLNSAVGIEVSGEIISFLEH